MSILTVSEMISAGGLVLSSCEMVTVAEALSDDLISLFDEEEAKMLAVGGVGSEVVVVGRIFSVVTAQ